MRLKSIPFVLFLLVTFFTLNKAVAQTVDMVGPGTSSGFGDEVTILTNGNYVVSAPFFSENGISNIGAVYLYNGNTHTIISTLKGTKKNDRIGFGQTTALTNGNFVVSSPFWSGYVGAATWCNGITGLTDTISSSNSLIGSSTNDQISLEGITALNNGNYAVRSSEWNSNTGAITWGDGTKGITGQISINNSLTGGQSGEKIGSQVISLSNGNYVVISPGWNGSRGAATWVSGTKGLKDTISLANSLVGDSIGDEIGAIYGNNPVALPNGNYIITSPYWHNGSGSATWCNGLTGKLGIVSSSNSIVGSTSNDSNQSGGDDVGIFIFFLSNGNYVVGSPYWGKGKGAVTWGNGNTGTVGVIDSTNSLVGTIQTDKNGFGGDLVGYANVAALTNGNYVIGSQSWSMNKGAATWANGNTGITGTISQANSLIGGIGGYYFGDYVGSIVTALTNGNYVVGSYGWNVGKGATTWCNGNIGSIGVINASNSLVGLNSGDYVGGGNGTITALTNGNYVVGTSNWNGGKGAATLCNGKIGSTGVVTTTNSMTGTNANDLVGDRVIPLKNGNYLLASSNWNSFKGALTWGNGVTGTIGTVSPSNSLVGNSVSNSSYTFFSDFDSITTLPNGNYIIDGIQWNGSKGVVSWGNGSGGTVGIPNSCNSIFGIAANGGYNINYAYNYTYNYLLVGRGADNIISRYYPALGAAIPSNNDNSTTTISGNSPFVFPTTTGCGQIAALTPSGSSPVSGSVTAKTWLESPQPTYFVARHYEITPATNPTTATGTITLYFTQADFDGFNNQSPAPASLLPNGPNDAVGKSHLLVQKEGGVSNVGTGLPGTYPGTVTTIDPADSNIVWNTALQRWEVTFDVTGFSGFFIKTQNTTAILPLTLLNFSGNRQGNSNLLQWTTSNEVGTKTFVVESSANGNSFAPIGDVVATGGGKYAYTDNNPIANRTYYRLKMVDVDGKFTYSNIIWISINGSNTISVYPNPVGQTTTLNISNNNQLIGTTAQLTDVGGRLLQQISINHNQEQLNMAALPAGLYLLKLNDGTVVKMMKQ